MHIYFRVGRKAFMAKYQTSPEVVEAGTEAQQLVESDLAAKPDRRDRGIVHRSCNVLTGMIDLHQEILD